MKFFVRYWNEGKAGRKLQAVLTVALLFLGIESAKAHGTLEFSASLVRPDDGILGIGIFTLTDHLFVYSVSNLFGLSQADVRGPGPASDAAVIFDLNLDYCEAPGPYGVAGGCFFHGSEVLTENQINDLVDGQWYVWAHSPSNPNQPAFGQIVPEPSSTVFLFITLGAPGAFWCLQVVRQRNRAVQCSERLDT